jgi:ABC-type antimicrobial peptide transport system permease subunit
MAARELFRRPGRAILTMVAVALATSLLTALVAIATTGRTRVLDQITHGGALAGISVAAASPNPGQEGLDNPTPGPAKTITSSALRSMERIPHVTSVVPVLQAEVIVVSPNGPDARDSSRSPIYRNDVVGINFSQGASLPISLVTGAYPAPRSMNEVDVTPGYLASIGLGSDAARTVIGTDVELGAFTVLDRNFRVGFRWSRVKIVGVINQQVGSGQFLSYPGLVASDVQWTAAGRANGDSDAPTSPYIGALVEADQLSDVSRVRSQIAAIGYSSSAPEDVIVSVEKYLHVIEFILTAIGVVALAIAALGIANALFAAVRERRREIGVMKAIGARDRDVMRAFLVEAGCVGFVGGIVGTAIGVAIFVGIGDFANNYLTSQGLRGVPITIAWYIPIGAVIGAALISVLAGAFPALKASRLSAREAVES